MLTPEELLAIADSMQPLLDDLNTFITKDIVRRFMARLGRGEADVLTGTDEWQLQVLQESGGHLESVQQELQKFTGKSEAEIKKIFEDAGIQSWEFDNAFYVSQGLPSVSLQTSERLVKILSDMYEHTNGEVKNFTKTTAKASQQRLINVLDRTHFKVMTGAQSYTSAVKEAVQELAKTQTKVTYPSGHTDTIETAVLRAVRTGVAQASGNISVQAMKDNGWDLVRVSAHLGARTGDGGKNPGNHFYWQGGLYSLSGKTKDLPDFVSTTGYGTGEGLCGWNCRHSFGPGDRDHNPYKDYASEDNKRAYELSQRQRELERQIRRTKHEVLAYKTAMDEAQDDELKKAIQADYDKAAAKLQKQNKAYSSFCKENNLKPLSDRTSVANWNRSTASQATAGAKRYASSQNTVEKSDKSGTINTRHSSNNSGSESTSELEYVKDLEFTQENVQNEFDDFSEEHAYSNIEYAKVITPNDKMYSVKGTVGTVDVESFVPKSDLQGAVVMHNHPVDNGDKFADAFSYEDLKSALNNETLIEFLCTGTKKYAFRFTEFSMTEQELHDIYKSARQAVFQNHFSDTVIKDYMSQYETMIELAKLDERIKFYEL